MGNQPQWKGSSARSTGGSGRLWLPLTIVALTAVCFVSNGCNLGRQQAHPSIEFTTIPVAAEGDPTIMAAISGRVLGATQDERIVLYARAGVWWVQPVADQPFTTINGDSTWHTSIHRGTEYAALLVSPGYKAPVTMKVLPSAGGLIAAVAKVPGAGTKVVFDPPRTLQFSGYQWDLRSSMSNRNGFPNVYDPSNAWTDSKGFLHLHVGRRNGRTTCVEVTLTQSLGYGTYHFVVQDTGHLDPSAILTLFTWEDAPIDPSHREMDIEMSRWGDLKRKNAQFLIQPYYVAANVSRFNAPAGLLTHTLQWQSNNAKFETSKGDIDAQARPIFKHEFTSGIPTPGSESVRMNFCGVGDASASLQHEAEVVIERFQYLP